MCTKTLQTQSKNATLKLNSMNVGAATVATTTTEIQIRAGRSAHGNCSTWFDQYQWRFDRHVCRRKKRTDVHPNAFATIAATITTIRTKTTASTSSTADGRRLSQLLTLFILSIFVWDRCIRGAYAAPQSCILCDKDDLKAKNPSTTYEEFLFEHQVTRQDAINSLRALNDSFYEGPPSDIACKAVICTKTVMKYCRGSQFINDHCWCELGHTDEGLPFVPHICYVGEKVYTASVGSCFFYEEVKECCCAPELAKQWRHISAAPAVLIASWRLLFLLSGLLIILNVAGRDVRRGSHWVHL